MKKILTILLLILIMTPTHLPAKELTVSSVVELFSARYEKINNYHCLIQSYEKSGRKTMNRIIDYYFMKPDCIYVKVLEGKNRGSSAIFRDNKVKASMGGILGKIRIIFKPSNKLVLSLRGHRLDESGWGHSLMSINKMIKDNWASKATENPEENTNQWILEFSTHTAGNPQIMHKYMIDTREKIVVAFEYYEDGELLEESIFKSIEINSGVDPKLFE